MRNLKSTIQAITDAEGTNKIQIVSESEGGSYLFSHEKPSKQHIHIREFARNSTGGNYFHYGIPNNASDITDFEITHNMPVNSARVLIWDSHEDANNSCTRIFGVRKKGHLAMVICDQGGIHHYVSLYSQKISCFSSTKNFLRTLCCVQNAIFYPALIRGEVARAAALNAIATGVNPINNANVPLLPSIKAISEFDARKSNKEANDHHLALPDYVVQIEFKNQSATSDMLEHWHAYLKSKPYWRMFGDSFCFIPFYSHHYFQNSKHSGSWKITQGLSWAFGCGHGPWSRVSRFQNCNSLVRNILETGRVNEIAPVTPQLCPSSKLDGAKAIIKNICFFAINWLILHIIDNYLNPFGNSDTIPTEDEALYSFLLTLTRALITYLWSTCTEYTSNTVGNVGTEFMPVLFKRRLLAEATNTSSQKDPIQLVETRATLRDSVFVDLRTFLNPPAAVEMRAANEVPMQQLNVSN